jgi:hypothetical protein
MVTYDFETGYRTAVYSDGSVKREPFDKAGIAAITAGPGDGLPAAGR